MQNQNTPPDTTPAGNTDSEIDILALFLRLWKKRALFLGLSTIATTLIIGGCALFFLFLPKTKTATLSFQLLFAGADKGEYPNASPFVTSDILTTSVLTKVYESNKLDKFFPFDTFKADFAVIQTSDTLSLLETEYRAQLSEKNLSPIDRKRIEEEFISRKKSALSPFYQLIFTQNSKLLPDDLSEKVMADILRTWVSDVQQDRKVNIYMKPALSVSMLDKTQMNVSSPIIASDILIITIERLDKHIADIGRLPGAQTVTAGSNKRSINDLKFQLENILKFKLVPLSGFFLNSATLTDPEGARIYVSNSLTDLSLRKAEFSDKQKVIEDSLLKYLLKGKQSGVEMPVKTSTGGAPSSFASDMPVMIPQLGKSFFEKIIEMSSESADLKFRQDLTSKAMDFGMKAAELDNQIKRYEQMMKALSNAKTQDAKTNQSNTETVSGAIASIQQDLCSVIEDIIAIQSEISRQNIDPQAQMYAQTSPVAFNVERPVSPKKLAMICLALLFVFEGSLAGLIIVAESIRTPTATRKS